MTRRLVLAALAALALSACGGGDDPRVITDARAYAQQTLETSNPGVFDDALSGDWTRVGTKVVFQATEPSCGKDTAGCAPHVVVVCLADQKPRALATGTTADRISERACR